MFYEAHHALVNNAMDDYSLQCNVSFKSDLLLSLMAVELGWMRISCAQQIFLPARRVFLLRFAPNNPDKLP